jgi:hypothetical protein
MFVSRESERRDSRKDRKFMEKRASLVWLFCQRGRKVLFWWTPHAKTFPPKLERKTRNAYVTWVKTKTPSLMRLFYYTSCTF